MAGANLACERIPTAARADTRRELIAAREAWSPDERAAADAALCERLHDEVERRIGHATEAFIGVYWPIRGEPDPRAWYARARLAGWTLALPRATPGQPLEFGRWRSDDGLEPGPWGIPLPAPFEPVEPALLVVPCVGFDASGWRLGYGGGFYDRTLGARRVPAVGVARAHARLGALEPGAHDVALDAIVTERFVLRPGEC